MLIDFISRKSKKTKEEATSYETLPSIEDPISEDSSTASNENDDDLHGIEFKEYANRRGLHTSEVWRLIRDGQLIARTENGFVYVYGIDKKSNALSTKTIVDIAKETSMADSSAEIETTSSDDASQSLPEILDVSRSTEVDYLIECLQNLQSENKDILKLSKDSISQITDISKQTIQAKDEIISHKDSLLENNQSSLEVQAQQLKKLKTKLTKQENDLNKLKQDNEDLEMLNQTLSTNL